MQREWPQAEGSDGLCVRWTKNLGIVFITGIFAVGLGVLIPVLIHLYLAGKLPEDLVKGNFILSMSVLGFFGLICILGFVSTLKNYFNPFIRFVINHEGVFLNILMSGKNAFFIPWADIAQIDKTIVKRSMGKGGVQEIDAVGFFLKNDSQVTLPKVMRGVEDCTNKIVRFVKDTMDKDVDEILQKANTLKTQAG